MKNRKNIRLIIAAALFFLIMSSFFIWSKPSGLRNNSAARVKSSSFESKTKDNPPVRDEEKPLYFSVNKKRLLGKVNPASDTLFIGVEKKYIGYEKNIYLLRPVYQSYKAMYQAAAKKGLRLNIISGLRTFYQQKIIWEAKWNGKRLVKGRNLSRIKDTLQRAKIILQYSSMPGTSRHHWGADIDIYSLENENFETAKGKAVYKWLISNAKYYGFCQVYTPKDSMRPVGYEEEKWHWSYFPISENLLKEYRRQIKYSDISGFNGSGTAAPLNVIENYVVGINRECK